MDFLRKNWQLTGIVILAIFLRVYNLLVLPIFTDESIYIYWAKFIATYHSHWFISITDGKPPLLIWIIAILIKVLPSHWYLIAGRVPLAAAGIIALFGTYKLTTFLFKSKSVGYLAAFLYAVNPFALFHDRMALFDSLLTAMVVWSVYFGLKTAKDKKISDAVWWGIFLGLAFLAKPTAIILFGAMPLCFIAYLPLKDLKKNWKRLSGLTIFAYIIAELFNNISRLSNAYPLMQQKNNQFQTPWDKVFGPPYDRIPGNFHALLSWLISYYTIPFFIVGMIAFIFLLRKSWRNACVLFSVWALSVVTFAIVGQIIYARYILYTTPFFLIPIAYFVSFGMYKKNIIGIGIIAISILSILPILQFDYYILTNPLKLAGIMPDTDYGQYIRDQSSGYGIPQAFAYINKKAELGHVTVVTQGTFGLYPYAFNLEYWNNKNVTVLSRWPLDKLDNEIIVDSKKEPVIIILKEKDALKDTLPLNLDLKIEKPNKYTPILITSVKP